ncbi:hypothetical protein [Pseudoalteromonas byunsanensis]|uniref:Solute-binding protein family 3/N-terminal domain-containing protein n=1 Tax=Pseudoalteromonas byunsanensis TaxID=327939 RepID=A0A1S1NDQ5_9GAMM|nr:hypothetical protein [Pseudoalteromonas byunsanensis]OHU96493.1 hypothetical protein BIW53_03975 [Pseudoalteromonas byunsanensis]
MKYGLLLILLFASNYSFSEQMLERKEFVISYVEHEGIIKYYVPLLNRAYQKIGIKPKFELINDKRALKLLDSGVIDADTAKSLEFIDDYKNIIVVPTPISQIDVVLLCQKALPCDLSVLKNANRSLGIIAADEFYAPLLADSEINIVELTSFETLLKIFDQNKVDYAIAVFDDYTKSTQIKYHNRFLIQKKIGYHLLSKKHQDLVQKLDQAIIQARAQGDFLTPK